MCLEAHETARRIFCDRSTYTKTAGGAQSTRHVATRPGTSCAAHAAWRARALGGVATVEGAEARDGEFAIRDSAPRFAPTRRPRAAHRRPACGASDESDACVQRAARRRRGMSGLVPERVALRMRRGARGGAGRRRRWRALRLGTASLGTRDSGPAGPAASSCARCASTGAPMGCVAQTRRRHPPSIGARLAARQRASGKSNAYVQRVVCPLPRLVDQGASADVTIGPKTNRASCALWARQRSAMFATVASPPVA